MRQWVSAEEAIGTINPDDHVVLPPGCSEVLTLEREIERQSERLIGLNVFSGLLLGDYPFISKNCQIAYSTYHIMGPIRELVENGKAHFLPISGSRVPELFKGGQLRADVALIHVSPPNGEGFCSFGVSVSYPYSVARIAERVIAQVNPRMPRTQGRCTIHISEIDLMVEVDDPLVEYGPPSVDEVSRVIGESVLERIPNGAVLQIGLGSIPEAVLSSFPGTNINNLTFFGMGTDGMVDLIESGHIHNRNAKTPIIVATELMGSKKLFDYAHENSMVEMRPSEYVLNSTVASEYDHFISVNSALQIDLYGQVNSEYIAGKHMGGIGGSTDFIQAARMSNGGETIIAFPAADSKKRHSRIVAEFSPGTPINVPRHMVETVVTEFGMVHLKGLNLVERAKALISIADPLFRPGLEEALHQRLSVAGAKNRGATT